MLFAPSVCDEIGHPVGDLPAHQHGAHAGRYLQHRQRHDEGGNADYGDAEGVDGAEASAPTPARTIATIPGTAMLAMFTLESCAVK